MKLHPLDLVILVVYMLGTLGVGWWFSRKQRNIRDYFLSGNDTPWWALMGSIVATETSTVTFISVPAFAFAANASGIGGNFTFLQIVIGYLIGRLIIVALFIPLYFKGTLFTVYQVLDQRFGGRVKRTAAALFLATRSIADGIRLFLTAIVLVALTGWADPVSILIIGAVTIAYTYLGGMAAVIWTDAIQLVVYLVGAVAAAFILLGQIPGGWSEVVAVGHEFQKFTLFDFTFDIARSYTFWAGVIGGAFLTTATHGTDQLMVQRYLSARSAKQATAALLTSGVVILAQFALFLLIGVMLFVFYQQTGPLPPEVAARADRVFPHFIVTQLPNGLIGLVVAAIFAAAMSTLSGSLNSLSATAVTDFYRPLFAPDKSDQHYLNVSRWLTAGWGAVQITVAMIAIAMQGRGVDAVLAVASFTNGPILGLFLLSTLTRRVGPNGALAGVITGIACMTFVWLQLKVSWQWYVLIGSTITYAAGSLASFTCREDRPTEAG
ncbi:MAG: sodium:solute symporter [Verrucomicrobiae bacterium]|nr:sodium:solute symporter [Verrucomicrobiae bacterium]